MKSVEVKPVWIDDELRSARAFSVDEFTSLDRFIDTEEIDLGIVDLIDVKAELLRHKDMQLAKSR